jgi:uncharacterized membrane protein
MPFLAGKGRYNDYWTYGSYGTSVGDVIKNAAPAPTDFITKVYQNISQNPTKTDTLWVFVLSSGFTVFFSWYALLAVPNLLVRMLSDAGTFYWSYWFHYGAVLMPIIFFCVIDVLRKIQTRAPAKHRKRLITTLCVAVCVYSFGLMFDKNLPYAQIFNPEFYSLNYQVRSGEGEVKEIVGDTSSITAPVVIMPHFANRESVHLLTDKGRWYADEPTVLTDPPATDYVLLNEKLPITDVDPSYQYADLRRDVEEIGYRLLYSNTETGWIIYQKAR